MKLLKNEQHNKAFLNTNLMGPNAIKLIKELVSNLKIEKGMRILDLACGTGLTSVFLAEEFDVTVFAADLWIDPSENYSRITQFGLQDRIVPLTLEAHVLPFAREYFDMVICIDAYNYFGAEPGYIEQHLAPFVKKGGIIAAVIPGLKQEFTNGVPQELQPFWADDVHFYTCDFWRNLWTESGAINVELCTDIKCFEEAWAD